MGYREVARCARCGTLVDAQITLAQTSCPKCQQDLRSCVQCTNFDPVGPLRVRRAHCRSRVSPKDVANECPLFEARTSLERETSTSAASPPSNSGGSPPAAARSPRPPARPSTTSSSSAGFTAIRMPSARGGAYNRDMGLLSASDEAVLKQHLVGHREPRVAAAVHADHRRLRERAGGQAGARRDRRRSTTRSPSSRRTSCSIPRTAPKYGVEREPAIVVLRDGEDTRMRFLGAPTGYEFVPLGRGRPARRHRQDRARARDGAAARGGRQRPPTSRSSPHPLDRTVRGRSSSRTRWRSATRTSPPRRSKPPSSWTCRASIRVTGVPKTIVNETIEILGALPEHDFVDAALQTPETNPRRRSRTSACREDRRLGFSSRMQNAVLANRSCPSCPSCPSCSPVDRSGAGQEGLHLRRHGRHQRRQRRRPDQSPAARSTDARAS